MPLRQQKMGGALVLAVTDDRIDAVSSIRFKDEVAAAARGGPSQVVLDLSRVEFIDSSGLGAIVAVMKVLSPEQQLDLANLAPIVDKVFRLTRMDSVFAIYPDVQTAIRAHVD
ncbi:STAS domain-containing protein [Aestuariibius insulae]|uniref:STAS domain-containing protein n=1 Tax=Aestuariibius insulae TaxID=2058287 RepID=UPI00345EF251